MPWCLMTLGKMTEAERNDPLEVLEDRYGQSTVMTSQLPITKE